MTQTRRGALLLCLCALAACGSPPPRTPEGAAPAEIDRLIRKWSRIHGVPEALVTEVVYTESRYNPSARNGSHYGLMQIRPDTARTMGFRGSPQDLLDAETNLQFGVKYLRGAWLVANRRHDEAIGWYRRGYYYEAKRKGLLRETGLVG